MHNDLTKALVLTKTMNYNASTVINDITRILYIYIIYISSNVTRLVITFFVVHLNLALWIWGLKVYNTLISPFYFRDLFHSSVNGVNGQWNIFNQNGDFWCNSMIHIFGKALYRWFFSYNYSSMFNNRCTTW